MNTKLLAGAFGVLVLCTTAGCDDTENTGGAGGATSTTSSTKATTGATMTTSTGTSTATGTSTGTGMATLDCTSYCSTVMANCTVANSQAQYNDVNTCMATCATFAPGTLADTSGDTLGCRLYHAGAPAASMPAVHCEHAGPLGGDQCIPTGGSECDSFCNEAIDICPTEWPELATCKTTCMGIPNTTPYTSAVMSGNSLACRMYHLMAASTMAVPHCPHSAGIGACN